MKFWLRPKPSVTVCASSARDGQEGGCCVTLLLFAMAILLVGAVAVLLLSRTGLNCSWLATGSVVIAAGLGCYSGGSSVAGWPGRATTFAVVGAVWRILHRAGSAFGVVSFTDSLAFGAFGNLWRGLSAVVAGTALARPGLVFYCLLVLGMVLVLLARNAVLFLVAWELMAVASFFLVTFEHERNPCGKRAGFILWRRIWARRFCWRFSCCWRAKPVRWISTSGRSKAFTRKVWPAFCFCWRWSGSAPRPGSCRCTCGCRKRIRPRRAMCRR